MTSFLLLTGAGAVAVLLRAAVVTRDAALPTTTVEPFEATGSGDAAADTICGEDGAKTLPPVGPGWQVKVFRSLADVETALDSLEACGVADREVHALGNDVFAIRWR
jgi:hypothetical protein